ncbi:MAG: transcription antitermination factor NusB [Candidatus Cloacimonadia bacterium]
MGLRRKGRELALQCLYNLDFTRLITEADEYIPRLIYQEVLNNVFDMNGVKPGDPVTTYANQLMNILVDRFDRIDLEIEPYLDKSRVDQLTPLDRNIMRMAIGEILYLETPAPVAINEAIEIAKKFCGDVSARFINGVLDNVAKELTRK